MADRKRLGTHAYLISFTIRHLKVRNSLVVIVLLAVLCIIGRKLFYQAQFESVCPHLIIIIVDRLYWAKLIAYNFIPFNSN